MAVRIQLRRDTASNWSTNNPVLRPGEVGVETDTLRIKIGPSVVSPALGTAWNSITTYANIVPSSLDQTLTDYIQNGEIGVAGGVVGLDSNKNAIVTGNSIIVEGTTDNSFETTLFVTDPTADRTITFPNASGTVALTTDIPTLNTDNVSEGTTNKYFTDERAQDAVDLALTAGTNITKTYSDVDNTLTIATSANPTFATGLQVTSNGLNVGTQSLGLRTSDAYTNPMGVFSIDSDNDYAQLVVKNTGNGVNSSTDIIAYSDNGNDAAGWIDMGVTSSAFSDPEFTITKANDGYIFMEAPATTVASVNNKALTTNTVTLTTAAAHGFTVGKKVTISGVGAPYNGTYVINGTPTSTTFTYSKTNANLASAAVSPVGTATQHTGNGDLVIATGANGAQNNIVFAAGGLQSDNTQMTIFPDRNVHIEIPTPSTSSTTGALTVVGGVGIQGDINIEGNLDVNGQVDLSGVEVLPIGPGAKTFADTLTNPTVVAVTNHNDYAQIAHQNQSAAANASTDIIMYTNNGTDLAGYIDMGITSSAFSDPDFTITGPGDGYIFVTGASGNSDRGNLVLATGDSGTQNKIIFAAGGLASDNEQMSITPDQNVHIEIATESTSATTGALTVVGGVGISGDLNIQGDVAIQGTITFGGGGTTVETENLAVTDPAIFVGTNNQADLVDLGIYTEFAVTQSPAITATVTNKALTNNIATLTTSANHTYLDGDVVTITGVDATFNGTFNIIDVPTTTTFTYAKTATNVTSAAVTPNGSASVGARRKFGGVVRDASDGVVKIFHGATTKPSGTTNFAEAGISYSGIKVGAIDASSATIGDVSNTELQYLNGVTSAIQTQLDDKSTASKTETLTNKTLTTPTINGPEITATGGTPRIHGIYLPEPHFITFEGATNNEFETVLTTVDPTADRTVSLPNATTTLVGQDTVDTLTNKTLTSPVINTPTGITKSDVGLANVDNTSDANKPVSTATQTALDLKVDESLFDAKGDLLVASADNTPAKLSVGINGYLLTANSSATNGVEWAAAPVSLPSQTGNSGKYLTTDGSSATWGTLVVPIETKTATVSANTATTVDTTALSAFTSIEYMISLKQGTKVRTSKVIVQNNGSSVDMTEFAITETGGVISGVAISAGVSGTDGVLQATITDATSTNVTVKLSKVAL